MTAMTGTAIVQAAYEDAGKLAEGQSASTAQNTRGLARLVDIIAFEATQGLKLWLEAERTITLVASTRQYTIAAPRPLQVTLAYKLASDGSTKTPVRVISREEYTRLSQLTQAGSVTAVFPDKQVTTIVLNVWNVPDATDATQTLKLVVREMATLPAAITDTLVFPTEWAMFLRWALADELSTSAPQGVQQRCAQRAQQYREALDSFDVEDASTQFQLDLGPWNSGSFR